MSSDEAEVAWRVEAMRPQVPTKGAIPLLKARPDAAGGGCLSCGATSPRARCAPCIEAANRAIAEVGA